MNVLQFLKERNVPYEVIPHPDTYTASFLAQAIHVPGQEVMKTVLLRLDHGHSYALALLPSTHRIDLERVSAVLGGAFVELADEKAIAEHCPDCERGVLPPFGTQYDLQSIMDESLTVDEEIVFEGNTHHEAIRMKYKDFYDLEHPLITRFAYKISPDIPYLIA